MRTVTWLHLSDLHACKPNTGWDSRRVLQTLRNDLQVMREEYDLKPDLIFFTGDAAYGQVGTSPGLNIIDQFRDAHEFLTSIREAFEPNVPQRNLFLVPGNHDVNITRITKLTKEALQSKKGAAALADFEQWLRNDTPEFQQIMQRLDDYAQFLDTYGYEHLLQRRHQLIYADVREVSGLRIGIAGFNSAWSSNGLGNEEMGKLWMAGRTQLELLEEAIPPHDFSIALVHHPSNWLVSDENPLVGREIEREHQFLLHGHEHYDFVKADATTGHTVLSAGACHEWSQGKNNGYNIVRIDIDSGVGEVFLREYDARGGGFRPRVVHRKTDKHGRWLLKHMTAWIGDVPSGSVPSTERNSRTNSHRRRIGKEGDTALDYEVRYRKAVSDGLDYMNLFGIDVPRESKEYSLSVAYVSLSLSDDLLDDAQEAAEREQDSRVFDDSATASPKHVGPRQLFDDSATPNRVSAEQLFDSLGGATKRLLIRGAAGCGKTTLLRWAAVQAARFSASSSNTESPNSDSLENESHISWRSRVPFIIRLRDYPEGNLPRPNELPLLLARHLPDPPHDWIDGLLREGRALILFDGVDEVPPKHRDAVLREVRALLSAYPDNLYVVTTRPEAVERSEFKILGFELSRIEPLTPNDRNVLILKWHDAMEVVLRAWNKPEDLRPLSSRLVRQLDENPTISRLTTNPLLCAVVCALHRERSENLPQTPVDLCEKLCEMLLDRRDRERPGPRSRSTEDSTWYHLDYRRRKGLLSGIAEQMVRLGLSAMPENAVDEYLAQVLKLQGSTLVSANIRRALLERSGMLQESSSQRIEFLHNTLKEYLAAERFVNAGDVEILAKHAHLASWQPVILFAVALPRDGSSFAHQLLRAILQRTPRKNPPRDRSKLSRRRAAEVRARQFLFVRCCAAAYQLEDKKIQAAFRAISRRLLPPATVVDAEALATCGEAIVPYLELRPKMRARQKAACVRALGAIRGPAAMSRVRAYASDDSNVVKEELSRLALSLMTQPDAAEQLPFLQGMKYLDASGAAVNPSLISLLRSLQHLNIENARLSDLSFLGKNRSLTILSLATNPVSDLRPLARLTQLNVLDLRQTLVGAIEILSLLKRLIWLELGATQVRSLAPLARLIHLTNLGLEGTRVENIKPLSKLRKLSSLSLADTRVSDVSPLSMLEALEYLDLSRTQVRDVRPLSTLAALIDLDLSSTKIVDVGALSDLSGLQIVNLSETRVDSVRGFERIKNLRSVNLSNTMVSDVTPLAGISRAYRIDLSGSQVSDLSPFTSLHSFSGSLNLAKTKVVDLSPLAAMKSMRSLNLVGVRAHDWSALYRLPALQSIFVGLNVSDEEIARFSHSNPQCKIHRRIE